MDILFHPPLVHFPIAFYFLELLLLIFWLAKKDSAYHRFALFSFRLGFLFMIAAAIAGPVDAGGIPPPVRRHFFSAAGVFTLYTVRAFYWRFGKEGQMFYRPSLVGGALAGNLLVGLTAFLGGVLVFS